MAIDWANLLSKAKEFKDSDAGKSLIAAGTAGVQGALSKKAALAGQDTLLKEGTEQEKSGKKLYENMLKQLRSGKYDVAQEVFDTAEDQKVAAEAFVDDTRKRGQEKRGDLISAIADGDPRMSALVPHHAQQIEQNIQSAELLGMDRKGAADAVVSGLEQDALGKQAALSELEMNRGGQGAEAGRQMRLNAMTNQAKAGPNAWLGALKTGISTYAGLKNTSGSEKTQSARARDNSFADMLTGELATSTDSTEGGGLLEGIQDIELEEEELEEEEFATGGVTNFEDGGGMTNGEFSHDRNPKAIIDEKTGSKEGELTGGELVFNVKQSDTIEELINSGKGDKLVKFMRELLSKEQFKA
tara:strand:+ start:518 stop:1588 length:1071 start_codon:yes stop_codon:yes gene_type:complete